MSTIQEMLAAKKQVAEKVAAAKERVFVGEYPTYQQYLTAKGKVVSFYKGYCKTNDPEVIAFCEELDTCAELKDWKEEDIPKQPSRRTSNNWARQNADDPAVMSPAELLQRAVASTATVPQAAASNSGPAAPASN